MPGKTETATARHGVTINNKKKHKKIKAYRKSLQREPTVNGCLLILDLKPYPKTRITESSDGFFAFEEDLIRFDMGS